MLKGIHTYEKRLMLKNLELVRKILSAVQVEGSSLGVHAWEEPLHRRALGLGDVATDPKSDATLLERGNCLNRIAMCFDEVEFGLQSGFKLNSPRCSKVDAEVLGDLMELQVQRHDEICIAWVRAPALHDVFPHQLSILVRPSTYPHNRAERIKNGRLGHRRSHPERHVLLAEFGVQATTQVIRCHRFHWPVAHLFCHAWEQVTHACHLHCRVPPCGQVNRERTDPGGINATFMCPSFAQFFECPRRQRNLRASFGLKQKGVLCQMCGGNEAADGCPVFLRQYDSRLLWATRNKERALIISTKIASPRAQVFTSSQSGHHAAHQCLITQALRGRDRPTESFELFIS